MQKTLMMVILGLTASQTAYASSLFNGKGTAVHDSRTQACLLAEQAARLDAARQAESFVQKTVTSTLFENEQGLSQSRAEYIENTVYGTAKLQGETTQQLRLLENAHIECTVEGRYAIDSAAIKQHLLAEQARVSRQTERDNTEAALLQELTANQQAYRDLQRQLPAVISGETSISTYCDVSLSLPACENVLKEQLALPYLQHWSKQLTVPEHLFQPTTQLQGATQLKAINSRVNQVSWNGSYQISLRVADPHTARNQEIQRSLQQLKQPEIPKVMAAAAHPSTDAEKRRWHLGLTVGSDCFLCGTSSMQKWDSINKTGKAAVKGNYAQASLHLGNWLSVNTGLYGENFALCEQAGRGKQCAKLHTDNATLPAAGLTVRYGIGYLEAMHLFAAKDITLGEATFKQSYQRFELGLNTKPTARGFYGAAGFSMRLLPKQEEISWNDTWDINLKLGYIF